MIIKNVAAYKDFESVEMNIEDFYNWLQLLKKENQLAGVNWSGKSAVGYDINPEALLNWIDTFKTKKNIW